MVTARSILKLAASLPKPMLAITLPGPIRLVLPIPLALMVGILRLEQLELVPRRPELVPRLELRLRGLVTALLLELVVKHENRQLQG